MLTTIELLREVVANHRATTLVFAPNQAPTPEDIMIVGELDEDSIEDGRLNNRLVVDMQTANVICLVYEAIKPENQAKVDRLMRTRSGFIKVAEISWKGVTAS